MNWSKYSRFVGDIFGAPLAMEGLAAFFVESTFLGLWIFGWGRLLQGRPPGVRSGPWPARHALSAYSILAANSWMQHPVGYDVRRRPKRELTNICRGALQQHRALRVRSTRSWRRCDRRDDRDRGLGLAPAPRQRDQGLRRRSMRLGLPLVTRGRRSRASSSATSTGS